MEKVSFLLISLFLINIKSEIEKCTYSFHCKKEDMDNICLKKLKTESLDIFDIYINEFSNSSCDIYNALLGDREKIIEFKENNSTFKRPSYPNGSCSDNSQCLSGICNNSFCSNSTLCFSHENCPLNTFCFKGECKNYLEDNDNCTESYQCKFNSFCDKKINKCRKLFFFEDGTDITDIINKNENMGEICKSGGYIAIKSNNTNEIRYYCETLFNENLSCRNKCIYKRKLNNETIIMEDKCLCGYNKYRHKYCILGNGQKEFIDYLNIRKDFLFNEEYIKKCHTLERISNEICNELINTNHSVTFRKYIQNYTNLKIKALEYHRIKDSDNCIKDKIFGYNLSPIIPIKQSCPKFFCDNNIKNCLYGINPFNEKGNNITIKLNNNICSINEYCNINNSINLGLNDAMKIMENENIEGQCSIYSYWPGKRFPGEDCNIDSDCFKSKCENGKCKGADNGEYCKNTYECKVGSYCNKNLSKCILQKNEGEQCIEGWDCQNYLGCYRGRCIKFGILKPGVFNSQKYSPFPGDERRYYLCNTGELDGDDGISGNYCVKTKYSEEWIKKNKKEIDDNGFIKCEYKESCFYDNGRRTIKKECGCGYNNEGQGYCPLPSSIRINEWNNRIKYIADFANNKCHTLSRFNCYLQNSIKDLLKKKYYDKNTVDAHLFYKSISCVDEMFSSYKHLNFDLFFIFSLTICLFF